MTMSYGDTVVERVEETVDDEYQERIVHQTYTVIWRYSYFATLIAGAVLAWVLPGKLSAWSALVLLPLAVSSVAGDQWMKQYSPRPRALRMTAGEGVLMAVLMLAWIAGVFLRVQSSDSSMAWGVLISGVTGAVIAYPSTAWSLKRTRAADEQRLDAELED
jgi:hypothetical protein